MVVNELINKIGNISEVKVTVNSKLVTIKGAELNAEKNALLAIINNSDHKKYLPISAQVGASVFGENGLDSLNDIQRAIAVAAFGV